MNSAVSSRVILCVVAGRSAFNSSYVITRRLAQEGFRVIYLGPGSEERHVRAQGLEFRAFDAEPDGAIDETKWGVRRRVREGVLCVYERFRLFERWCEELRPELVLLDANLLVYSVPFLKRGVPIVSLNTTLASSFQMALPPVFSNYIPKHPIGFGSRVMNTALWLKLLARNRRRKLLLDAMVRFSFGYRREYRELTAIIERYGGKIQWTEYGPRLRGDELIVCPKEFDFPGRVLSPDQCYAGAGIELNRRDGEFDWKRLSPSKKIIYCSLGTCSTNYPHRERFYRVLIEAISSRAKHQLILSVQEKSLFEKINCRLPNIILLPGVPQIEVLKRTDVFLSQGGFNSVKESLCLGVPIIVFPGWHDQFGNAARIMFHRVGLRGDMARINPGGLNQMLDRVLLDPAVTQGVSSMQQCFMRTNDCQQGVQIILDRLTHSCAAGPSRKPASPERAPARATIS